MDLCKRVEHFARWVKSQKAISSSYHLQCIDSTVDALIILFFEFP